MAANTNTHRSSGQNLVELNPGLRARQALETGDFKLARTIAHEVLKDPGSPQAAKDEASIIINATKVDFAPLVAGAVMFVVLALVFFFVLRQAHPA